MDAENKGTLLCLFRGVEKWPVHWKSMWSFREKNIVIAQNDYFWEKPVFSLMLLRKNFWRPLDWADRTPDTNRAVLSVSFPRASISCLGRKEARLWPTLPLGSGTCPPSPSGPNLSRPLSTLKDWENSKCGLAEWVTSPCHVIRTRFSQGHLRASGRII